MPCPSVSEAGDAESPKSGAGVVPRQPGSANEAMRVLQLKMPEVFRYSFVYQNVQSLTGSMAIEV